MRSLQSVNNIPTVYVLLFADFIRYSLAPKYEELGRLYTSHNSQVTIAKVDATANDVPDEIAGFPTIKLFPGNSKSSPIDYSGSRSVEDLVAFIRDNGSHKIDAYAEGDLDMPDADQATTVIPGATEEMQHQAPAATQAPSAPVKDAVAGAASVVVEAVEAMVGGDDNMDNHDEL